MLVVYPLIFVAVTKLICSYNFVAPLIVLLTPLINKPDSSRDLTTFKMSSIFSFEIIRVCYGKSEGCKAHISGYIPDPFRDSYPCC